MPVPSTTAVRAGPEVTASIAVAAGDWFTRLTAGGWSDRRPVVTTLGLRDGRPDRPTTVTVGPVRSRPDGTATAHIHWQDRSHPRLFPTLDGSLAVNPLPSGEIALELRARYAAPLGRAGRILEQTLVHGMDDTPIRSFLVSAASILHLAAMQTPGRRS